MSLRRLSASLHKLTWKPDLSIDMEIKLNINFFVAIVVIAAVVVGQVREAAAECKVPTTKPDFDVTRVS